MSTQTPIRSARQRTDRTPAQSPSGPGTLRVRDVVIEKTASQILRENALASAAPGAFRTLLGTRGEPGEHIRPKARAEVSGGRAEITVHLSLPYPLPLRKTTEALRDELRQRVHQITGIPVGPVDLRIEHLVAWEE
ncbi:hypothetical protein [Nesterenkonia muleiensis]|uniref:hypothetical protein n=1 Tax=Nesterenkonia muleiensis TaxID=2282648 RepID=UPI0013009E99|nr:hypothetical protein [Nesterenkonia muleiensis]